MKAGWQGVALRATARLIFGSGAARAVLGSGALGLGALGCSGRTMTDAEQSASRPASSAGAATTTSDDGASSGSVGAAGQTGAGASAGAADYLASSRGGAATGSIDGHLAIAGASAGGEATAGGGASTGGSAGSAAGGADSAGGATSACVGPSVLSRPAAPPGPTAAEFSCCLDLVSNATTDWQSPEGKELMSSEPIVNCCRAMITAVDLDGRLSSQTYRLHTPCCGSSVAAPSEIYQHTMCAPWGPPTPPALDWQVA